MHQPGFQVENIAMEHLRVEIEEIRRACSRVSPLCTPGLIGVIFAHNLCVSHAGIA